MSERVVTPGGPWVNAGAFEVRTVLEDPIGTIRVRPVSSDEPRRFKDCDGDVWIEVGVSSLQHVGSTVGDPVEGGRIDDRSWIEHQFGPLTEIRPDVDVRALLADVLEELANDVLQDYWGATDPTSERIYGKLAHRIRGRALKLREEGAG